MTGVLLREEGRDFLGGPVVKRKREIGDPRYYPSAIKETESKFKKTLTERKLHTWRLHGKFHQTFKEKMVPAPYKRFQNFQSTEHPVEGLAPL